MLSPYNGHFIPLAFMAEFLQAKLYGTSEAFWFSRQMLVCGTLGAACGHYIYRVASDVVPPRHAMVAAVGGSAFFLFQPFMLEMVSWPFMVFQLLALTLTAVSASSLAQYVQNPRPRTFLAFVFLAYSTMHVSGVGAAVSVAALATAACVLTAQSISDTISDSDRRICYVGLFAVAILTVGHGLIMTVETSPASPPGGPLTLQFQAARFFSLLMDSSYAATRAMWANGGFPWPRLDVQRIEAVYGFGLAASVAMILLGLLCRAASTGDRQCLASFATTAYPCVALLAYTMLIATRLRGQSEPNAVLAYLIGGRYLLFPSFFIFLTAVSLSRSLFSSTPLFCTTLPGVLTLTAAIGTAVFATTEMPRIWPHTQVDTAAEWQAIVSTARSEVAAGAPVTNRSLKSLDPGFQSDLRKARYLLQWELGGHDGLTFAP